MKSPRTIVRQVWPWVCLALAIFFAFQFGAIISTLLLGLSALMCASETFREFAAQGKRVMGPVGRVMTASIAALLAFALLPGKDQPASQRPVQVAESEPTTISKSTARELCEGPIRQQLTHPSTADFSSFSTAIVPRGDGAAIYAVGLTAKNSFGLELNLRGYCNIVNGEVTSAHVEEEGS